MTTNQYEIIVTPTGAREISRIYEYISEDLYAEKAAKDLMKNLEEEFRNLKSMPQIHTKIEKVDDELMRNYRRIVIKNFVVLYTIDEEHKIVYISHMYYGKRNY